MSGRKTIEREPTVDKAPLQRHTEEADVEIVPQHTVELGVEVVPISNPNRVKAKVELQKQKDAVSAALEAGKKAYAEVEQKNLLNPTEAEIVHGSKLDRLEPKQKKAVSMGFEHGDVNLEFLKAVLPVLHELSKDHMTPRPVGPDARTVELRENIAEARRVLQERGYKP